MPVCAFETHGPDQGLDHGYTHSYSTISDSDRSMVGNGGVAGLVSGKAIRISKEVQM